ncbi:hypothetical protein R3P38DRAFT_3225203 [Favolaschia claudopus]|uniref:Uncharacterized protein n=1 Tax=Favolaschia claudopus TaxID=2862362 RepID=A0AAV9ZV06_9AGAR
MFVAQPTAPAPTPGTSLRNLFSAPYSHFTSSSRLRRAHRAPPPLPFPTATHLLGASPAGPTPTLSPPTPTATASPTLRLRTPPVLAPAPPAPKKEKEQKESAPKEARPAASTLPAPLLELLRNEGPYLANEVFSCVPTQPLEAIPEDTPAPRNGMRSRKVALSASSISSEHSFLRFPPLDPLADRPDSSAPSATLPAPGLPTPHPTNPETSDKPEATITDIVEFPSLPTVLLRPIPRPSHPRTPTYPSPRPRSHLNPRSRTKHIPPQFRPSFANFRDGLGLNTRVPRDLFFFASVDSGSSQTSRCDPTRQQQLIPVKSLRGTFVAEFWVCGSTPSPVLTTTPGVARPRPEIASRLHRRTLHLELHPTTNLVPSSSSPLSRSLSPPPLRVLHAYPSMTLSSRSRASDISFSRRARASDISSITIYPPSVSFREQTTGSPSNTPTNPGIPSNLSSISDQSASSLHSSNRHIYQRLTPTAVANLIQPPDGTPSPVSVEILEALVSILNPREQDEVLRHLGRDHVHRHFPTLLASFTDDLADAAPQTADDTDSEEDREEDLHGSSVFHVSDLEDNDADHDGSSLCPLSDFETPPDSPVLSSTPISTQSAIHVSAAASKGKAREAPVASASRAATADRQLPSTSATTRKYHFSNATESGETDSCSVPGGQVHRLTPKSSPPNLAHSPPRFFFGNKVGVFQKHEAALLQASVKGAKPMLQVGYPSAETAEAAIKHARSKGWTSDTTKGALAAPQPSTDDNPLSAAGPDLWYVVCQGVNHASFGSRSEAEREFQLALDAGLVKTVQRSRPL